MKRKNAFWIALWVILVIVTGYFAFGYGAGIVNYNGYRPWQGWGPMAGWNRGEGYPTYGARGWSGMGPGMMGGPGSGYWSVGNPCGMMGQYGGMPGFSPGMGLGMIEGNYAMMPWWLSDLTSDQADKLGKLQLENAERNQTAMQQIWDAQIRLNELYAAPTRDWNAIRAGSKNLFDLQRQQLDGTIDLQQKIDAILTDSQRQELTRDWHRYGWMGAQ